MRILYSALYEGDAYPFNEIANHVEGVVAPEDLQEKDSALVVWGGADINPSLYKHKQSSRTFTGGWRDYAEWQLMQRAIHLGIPIIGICRGAQMACAAAGGFLIQDALNHGIRHKVKTINDEEIVVNSLHHQMMFVPEEVDHELLAWCSEPRSCKLVDGEIKHHYIYQNDQEFVPPDNWKEPEAIFFPNIKALAIQWHPEMMDEECSATQFIFQQMGRLGWLN